LRGLSNNLTAIIVDQQTAKRKAHGAKRPESMPLILRKDTSPCGIVLRANNLTSVESVFHGASRKAAKHAKFLETIRIFKNFTVETQSSQRIILKRILTADSRRLTQTKKGEEQSATRTQY